MIDPTRQERAGPIALFRRVAASGGAAAVRIRQVGPQRKAGLG